MKKFAVVVGFLRVMLIGLAVAANPTSTLTLNVVSAGSGGGGPAVVQTLTDHGVASSHANGAQKCVWQFSRPIGTGDTVIGYVHSANNNDSTEMYPQAVYDNIGHTYNLSHGVHWKPYPEDIGIWYLTNIKGSPNTFTFDYTQYPASGNTVLDFCDLGFVEYSGVTGINAVVNPFNDNASGPSPSLTISPTASSLIWLLGATNSGPDDGSDLLTTGYSLLINNEPPDGFAVWGSNSMVSPGSVKLTWKNDYWNASVCQDSTHTTTGCTTIMAAIALSVPHRHLGRIPQKR
jgi:hypothetical protein